MHSRLLAATLESHFIIVACLLGVGFNENVILAQKVIVEFVTGIEVSDGMRKEMGGVRHVLGSIFAVIAIVGPIHINIDVCLMVVEQLLPVQYSCVHLLQIAKRLGIEAADGKNLRTADGELRHVADIPPQASPRLAYTIAESNLNTLYSRKMSSVSFIIRSLSRSAANCCFRAAIVSSFWPT